MSVQRVDPSSNTLISEVTRRVFSVMDPDFDSWQILPGESEVWYNRFSEYLAMRPYERSVLRTCNRERYREGLPPRINLPYDWNQMSVAWRWKSRATAFDDFQSKKKAYEFEEEKTERKKKHIQNIGKFQEKVEDTVEEFDPTSSFFRLSEITGAIQAIGKEQRAEFNDEPTKKANVQVSTMAELLRATEKELGYGSSNEPIDAEWNEVESD